MSKHTKGPLELRSKKRPRLEVVDQKTGAVVHTVELHGTAPRHVEKVLSGFLRKVDTDRFFVREVDVDA